jgi:hypothetical protein
MLSGDVYRGAWCNGRATGHGKKMTFEGTNIEGELAIDSVTHETLLMKASQGALWMAESRAGRGRLVVGTAD